ETCGAFARTAIRAIAAVALIAESTSLAFVIPSSSGTKDASPTVPADHAAWATTDASWSLRKPRHVAAARAAGCAERIVAQARRSSSSAGARGFERITRGEPHVHR